MGDTGSLALGGALAGIAILSHTEALLPIVGFVFVCEALSVILQVVSFQTRGKRIFRMSPIHHHFELGGWSETRVVYTFWAVGAAGALLAGIIVLLSLESSLRTSCKRLTARAGVCFTGACWESAWSFFPTSTI